MKSRLIFDISPLGFSNETTGILRFTIEVLRRLIERNLFDVTLICSNNFEETALRNFYENVDFSVQQKITFQSKEVEHFVLPSVLPSNKPSNPLFGYLEGLVRTVLPDSEMLESIIEKVRVVKRKIIPADQLTNKYSTKRERSSLLEQLIRNSDVYFSPYSAVVPEIDVNPHIRKLQVIHDLALILFPYMFPKNWSIDIMGCNHINSEFCVLVNSQCTKNDLLRCFSHISESQIIVIPLGADEYFHPCSDRVKIESVLKKYGISYDIDYILSVATLEIRKNFDHLIRSFAKLIEGYDNQFPNIKLILTGNKGWLDKKIHTAYKKLSQKIKKRIIFTGYVDDADLPFLYNGAVCFCYMSLYEGFGLPPLEAMQSGTPVITSNTSSLPEVVGNAGIMLDPHDVDGLANAFYRVLTDNQLRNEMIQKGLEQAKKFSWDRCVDLIVEKMIH